MPTAGTHITIIERLALGDEGLSAVLGDPNAEAGDDAALLMRFAKLGAIGPDLFYAMADYGPELQDLVNFLSKIAGSVECISDITKKVDQTVVRIESDVTFGASDAFRAALDEITDLFTRTSATMRTGLMALAVDQGFNFWPVFEARRQVDQARETWFWADYLHYVRSGEFVRQLVNGSRGNRYHTAYALGYLSHYVTDVVGHPFVNMCVGAPWRSYWQRHHLVENFIDAYVWDRWHVSRPAPAPPSTDEAPLDRVVAAPNAFGTGAPMTFSRLNDHINIGVDRANDPVDRLISDICERIDQGLEDIGAAEPTPEPPADADFADWTTFMAAAFRAAYPAASQPPENLRGGGRPDGYPTADDIAAAYSVLRLFLRVTTEQSVSEPECPNVAADVWKVVQQTYDKVAQDLGSIPPLPSMHVGGGGGGGFSLSDMWKSLCDWVRWAADTAIAVGKAAIDLIRGAVAAGGVLLVDTIRMGLYLVKKALFDLYESFRFYLIRTAYALPRIDELHTDLGGGVRGSTLWKATITDYHYPFTEIPNLEHPKTGSHYAPWIPVWALDEMKGAGKPYVESAWTWPGPYDGRLPDAFIDDALGTREMLSPDGPVRIDGDPDELHRPQETFGGSIENCRKLFAAVIADSGRDDLPAGYFPDYNLDGDRGYAWPCWDVARSDAPHSHLHPPPDGGPVEVDAFVIGEN